MTWEIFQWIEGIFFEVKREMLYMPGCRVCPPLFIWRTWLVPYDSFVNLNGTKARTRNLISQWDKFPLYQSLAKRLINESVRVFVSLYCKYITFKLGFLTMNWLKLTDYKNQKADINLHGSLGDNGKKSCDFRGPGFYPVALASLTSIMFT